MVDVCVISRSTPGVFDAGTGDYATSTLTLYSGKCRLRAPSAAQVTVTERIAGDAEQATNRAALILPAAADTSLVEVGDRVEVTGRGVFTVVGRAESSTLTADGFLIERVEGAVSSFSIDAPQLVNAELDTGWRVWPEVAQTLTFTGGTADVRARFLQRRIGPHVHSAFLFTVDSPGRTATAGTVVMAPFDITGHMFPTDAYATPYTGHANLAALPGNNSGLITLQTGRALDTGWSATLSVSWQAVRSTSVVATGVTYRTAGGAPVVTDDPWPTVLPGEAFTP